MDRSADGGLQTRSEMLEGSLESSTSVVASVSISFAQARMLSRLPPVVGSTRRWLPGDLSWQSHVGAVHRRLVVHPRFDSRGARSRLQAIRTETERSQDLPAAASAHS